MVIHAGDLLEPEKTNQQRSEYYVKVRDVIRQYSTL